MEKKGFWAKYGAYVVTVTLIIVALTVYSFATEQVEVDDKGKPVIGGKRTKTRFAFLGKKA